MNTKLNISNPHQIIYEHGILTIAVLGGIRLEGLDRMRVTVKITVEHLALRHNLDLYNDNQVEKLIRKVAEKLEIGTSVITSALNELMNLLEEYRLEALEDQAQERVKTYTLTDKERKEAEHYLTAPNLLERTKEDIGKSGVIGEENNRLLMYLIFTSRKTATPLHVVSLGASGTGKTHLQEKVAELIPEEDTLSVTSLSENAFYYFERNQLSHKLILIEDLDGLSGTGINGAYYSLRELQSKKRISKTIVHKNSKGETRSINLEVEGPVCVAGCTTKERLYEDNANRSFLIYLDESEQQDERIMAYQRAQSASQIDTKQEQSIAQLLRNTQRVLQPIKVVNPYAELLCLPKSVFKPRRTNSHYLQFIEVITFYCQAQRAKQYDKQTGEEYIETTLEDIEQANKLMKTILLRKSDELSGACRNYFEALKAYLKERDITTSGDIEDASLQCFTNREIRQVLRISATTLRRYHNELLEAGHISIFKGKQATGYIYQLTDAEEYKKLQQSIDTVLDEMLEKVKCATTPQVSHSQNGSPKTKSSKAKKPVNH